MPTCQSFQDITVKIISRVVKHPVVEEENIRRGETRIHFHRAYGSDALGIAKTYGCIDEVKDIRIVIGVTRQPDGWRSHVIEKNECASELFVFDVQLLRIGVQQYAVVPRALWMYIDLDNRGIVERARALIL